MEVQVHLRNKGVKAAPRTVFVTITSATLADRDVEHITGTQVDKVTHTVRLSSEAPSATVKRTIHADEYRKWLREGSHDSLLFSATGQVEQTGQIYATLDALPTVKLAVPPLQLKVQQQ